MKHLWRLSPREKMLFCCSTTLTTCFLFLLAPPHTPPPPPLPPPPPPSHCYSSPGPVKLFILYIHICQASNREATVNEKESKRGMTWKFVRGNAQVETGLRPPPRPFSLVISRIRFSLFNQDGPNAVNSARQTSRNTFLHRWTTRYTNVNFHFKNLLTIFFWVG